MIHVLWGPGCLRSLFFYRREKYCHDGGMALVHHHGVGEPGSKWRRWPLLRSLKSGVLQAKVIGAGIRTLWGQG
jgi:hypothetical protein